MLNSHMQYFKDGSIKRVDINLKAFVEKIALSYGSSLKGRMDSFKYLTNCSYKPVIIISNTIKCYFLATRSLNAKDCTLINYQALNRYKAINNYQTLLIFKNGLELTVDVNYRIIKRQTDLINQYENAISLSV